jgi:RHS repeat-associated protein
MAAESWTDYGSPEPGSGAVRNGPNPGNGSPAHDTKLNAGTVLPLTTGCTPLGYTGELANPDGAADGQGLLHFYARSYQPGTSQWTSPDPWSGLLTRPSSLNKYSYTEADPTSLWDVGGFMLPADGGTESPGGYTLADPPQNNTALNNLGAGCLANWTSPRCAAPSLAHTINTINSQIGAGTLTPDGSTDPSSGPTPATDPANPTSSSGRYPQAGCGGFVGCVASAWNSTVDGLRAGADWALSALGTAADFLARNNIPFTRIAAGALLVAGGILACTADGVVTGASGGTLLLTGASELAGAACISLAAGGIMLMANGASNIQGPGGSGPSAAAEEGHGSAAEKIANGHAYDKHVVQQGEYPEIATRAQFQQLIQETMDSATAEKPLSGARYAYWNASDETVVITDPNSSDGGTALRPTNGYAYYQGLR